MNAVWLSGGLFIAAGISGMTGLAFPTIAIPLLLAAYPPEQTIALTATCSVLGQLTSFLALRGHVEFTIRYWLIISGLIGVPIGYALLLVVDRSLFGIFSGSMILLASLWWLLKPSIHARVHSRWIEAAVGLVGGLCGGLTGLSAPIPSIWCVARGLPKLGQRGVMQPYIMAIQLTSWTLLWCHGVLSHIAVSSLAALVAPVIIGSWCGTRIFHACSNDYFTHIVMGLTALSGLAVIFE